MFSISLSNQILIVVYGNNYVCAYFRLLRKQVKRSNVRAGVRHTIFYAHHLAWHSGKSTQLFSKAPYG